MLSSVSKNQSRSSVARRPEWPCSLGAAPNGWAGWIPFCTAAGMKPIHDSSSFVRIQPSMARMSERSRRVFKAQRPSGVERLPMDWPPLERERALRNGRARFWARRFLVRREKCGYLPIAGPSTRIRSDHIFPCDRTPKIDGYPGAWKGNKLKVLGTFLHPRQVWRDGSTFRFKIVTLSAIRLLLTPDRQKR